ncbi:ATP-binding cassette domain-containing protein [Alkalicoccus chagannorensis]|uniref:ATP-binding cassette domain-containing protein n=1 Tax=Alkalicoccus chagannorensis TaxID=427072 RepID=UPI00047CE025|nr:ABC transporter ATP-binding protein [Alkalicoccus chagannorensis]
MSLPLAMTGIKKEVDGMTIQLDELMLPEETITAVVGRNGAGKSTLFKMAMNLVKPDEGRTEIFGLDTAGEDETWRGYIAYQSQQMHGVELFTGEKLREMTAGLYASWEEELFQDVVSRLDIPLKQKVQKLSPGEKTKLNLALNIGKNTPLLILDEPTAAMDIPARQEFLDLLLNWMDRGGKTVLLASHQVDDIKKLADYLVFIEQGKASAMMEKDEITASWRLFWTAEQLPMHPVPGEVQRPYQKAVLSHAPDTTRAYLLKHGLTVQEERVPELEEVIHQTLTNGAT